MQSSTLLIKHLEILKLLFKFRFLDRHQLQSLLKHKHHHRILIWLNYLTKHELIGRIYSHKFGENTKPAIYYLRPKGRRILKKEIGFENEKMAWVYSEGDRKRQFIDHCLFIVSIYLNFLELAGKGTVHFLTATDLKKYPYLMEELPDAYIVVEQDGKVLRRYFLNIFDFGTPFYKMRNRVQEYIEYFESHEWESNTKHSFPFILLICPSQTMKWKLHRFIKDLIEEGEVTDMTFYLTTKDNIKYQGIKKEVWQQVK